jgi:hypothetical protein
MRKVLSIARVLLIPALIGFLFIGCEEGEEDPSTPQSIKAGWWSNPSKDVQFYISEQTQLDTLRITYNFSGACSGSIVSTTYPVSITNRAFSRDLGSSWEETTGSIQGTFTEDGQSCSGTLEYNRSPCDPINISWTASPD